jgi:hypothetical protein
MLYTNLSVESTLLEGFTANGSLGCVWTETARMTFPNFRWNRYRAAAGYDFDLSYTSHAHGWSTGNLYLHRRENFFLHRLQAPPRH